MMYKVTIKIGKKMLKFVVAFSNKQKYNITCFDAYYLLLEEL